MLNGGSVGGESLAAAAVGAAIDFGDLRTAANAEHAAENAERKRPTPQRAGKFVAGQRPATN